MLGGLLHFRRDVDGIFSVGRLLWKQVGSGTSALPIVFSIYSVQGLIWLFIATVAEVPPMVCLELLEYPPSRSFTN